MFHRAKKRLIISRHVIHDEKTFPFHQGSVTTTVLETIGKFVRYHPILVLYVLPSSIGRSQPVSLPRTSDSISAVHDLSHFS